MTAGGLPKAMQKISIKMGTNKMHKNQIWEAKCSKIVSHNGLRPLIFTIFEAASGRQPEPPNHKQIVEKHDFSVTFSFTSAFVAAYVLYLWPSR